ncbi:hypothetical protein BDU57DRAFT_207622 [Ampelomyces quisqualis]|uniref:Uncharacterized protein n=1 Tax=Ampelomyces quisqualis TaxID=50730 RepID=A0A6A5QM32_AMPQU|nr:hypothetical protein BDU57DRAFT_207622 [Ampelomyces quisqualis]
MATKFMIIYTLATVLQSTPSAFTHFDFPTKGSMRDFESGTSAFTSIGLCDYFTAYNISSMEFPKAGLLRVLELGITGVVYDNIPMDGDSRKSKHNDKLLRTQLMQTFDFLVPRAAHENDILTRLCCDCIRVHVPRCFQSANGLRKTTPPYICFVILAYDTINPKQLCIETQPPLQATYSRHQISPQMETLSKSLHKTCPFAQVARNHEPE